MTTDELSTADVLREARDAIVRRGWNQGSFENQCGGVCAMGAINLAQTEMPDEQAEDADPALVLLHAIDRADEDEHELDWDAIIDRIATWNDASDRTKEDVLAAFEDAIALATPPANEIPFISDDEAQDVLDDRAWTEFKDSEGRR